MSKSNSDINSGKQIMNFFGEVQVKCEAKSVTLIMKLLEMFELKLINIAHKNHLFSRL